MRCQFNIFQMNWIDCSCINFQHPFSLIAWWIWNFMTFLLQDQQDALRESKSLILCDQSREC